VQKHDITSHVTFVGEVPYHQIRTIYSLFDVSVFLSQEHESFGLTPLESMAMGKPTIVTSSFGFLDADARTRLLVIEPHQVDKVAEWVEMLHSDPVARKKIADEGYHFMQKRFSVDYMAAKYEKVFLNPPTKVA
jgi:glycosyltransferase involved in cell wall biosynthesis